ncbi:hypothetical protein [Siminovitchia terrae]|uniref:hypothetical protein n=1 Tax=Siminovitchia terrae TaxID=1914933 RepID=UPI0028B15051|nr:hypothetical protein [Siminovitchia terrae]
MGVFQIKFYFDGKEQATHFAEADSAKEILDKVPETGFYFFTTERGTEFRVDMNKVNFISVAKVNRPSTSSQTAW